MSASPQLRLITTPAVGLYPVTLDIANDLLCAWGHKLGACCRPFHSEAFTLEVLGRPVATAISASIVNGPVGGFERSEVVELARIGACGRWANRVMIRLWREVCAPAWPCWRVRAAISYSKNSLHSGDLYRFDGWKKVRDDCGSGGGGTWSKLRAVDSPLRGTKTLWLWQYAPDRKPIAPACGVPS